MARKKKVVTESEVNDLGVLDMSTPNMVMGKVEFEHTNDAPVSLVSDNSGTTPSNFKLTTLGFWHADGKEIPEYATQDSVGLDLRANLVDGREAQYYDYANAKRSRKVRGGTLVINPGERFLIPTGLCADIPNGYWLAIHARSGTSWKQGLALTNGVAVIDTDYVEEIFVSITNISGARVIIEDGERIAQAVLMQSHPMPLEKLNTRPTQKTSRNGGFGSTGTK